MGGTIALNKDTGAIVWRSKGKTPGFSSPVSFDHDGQRYVAVFPEGGLQVLRLNSGKPVAEYAWKTPYHVNAGAPVVEDGKIFITSGYGVGCALLTFEGGKLNPVYRHKKMSAQTNPPVLYKGRLYGFSGNVGPKGELVCMEFAIGKIAWTHKDRKQMGAGSLIVAGGKLIILGQSGVLTIAEATPEGYREHSSLDVEALARQAGIRKFGPWWIAPALAEGKVFCRNSTGALVCIDLSK